VSSAGSLSFAVLRYHDDMGCTKRGWRQFRFDLLGVLLLFAIVAESSGNQVLLLELDGAIGPATSAYVTGVLEQAHQADAELAIIKLNTPGGLDTSMRDIIQAILSSDIPIVTYVAPAGSRAASAGTYILYASHVAAMAPATNLGAATPIQIGGMPNLPRPPDEGDDGEDQEQDGETPPTTPMQRKLVNDASAYLRSLAQLRGRNEAWADQAVQEGASLTAREALEKGVIDLLAVDERDLLKQLDGREIKMNGDTVVLATRDLVVETRLPDWRDRVLAIITNPQVAYVLMLLGVYGLFFELSNPGAIVPGVLGAICLLLALFAFQVLPVNLAGLALLLLGLAFMIAEAFVPSFGVLGLGGLVAFVVGSMMLWQETGPGFEVPLGLIVGFAIASGVLIVGLGRLVLHQRRRPVVSGSEEMIGATGVAVDDLDREGTIHIHGESWLARSVPPARAGATVRVVGRDGLVLEVRPCITPDAEAEQ